jgi:hypothetical protein
MPLFNPTITSVSGISATKIEIDVGNEPIYAQSLDIIDIRATTSSQILVWQDATSNSRSSDENEMDALTFSVSSNSGFFRINITATPGPIAGPYVINYLLL